MLGITNQVWQVLIAGFLAVHGLGHILYLLPSWGIVKFPGIASRSWLLTNLLGEKATAAFGGLLWLAALVAFVAAGAAVLGILIPPTWWRSLAIAGAVVSLVGLILFWGSGPGVAPAIADLVVLVALLVLHWPPATIASV